MQSVSPPKWSSYAAVCVILASQGYPGKYEKGKEISGLEKVSQFENALFSMPERRLKATGRYSRGRVLGLTTWDPHLRMPWLKLIKWPI